MQSFASQPHLHPGATNHFFLPPSADFSVWLHVLNNKPLFFGFFSFFWGGGVSFGFVLVFFSFRSYWLSLEKSRIQASCPSPRLPSHLSLSHWRLTVSHWVRSAIRIHPGLLPTFSSPSLLPLTTLLDTASLFPSSLCIPNLLLSQ